jgi:hypothetical protein
MKSFDEKSLAWLQSLIFVCRKKYLGHSFVGGWEGKERRQRMGKALSWQRARSLKK